MPHLLYEDNDNAPISQNWKYVSVLMNIDSVNKSRVQPNYKYNLF